MMLRSVILLTLCTAAAGAQTMASPKQCAVDTLGNEVCIGSQPDQTICGCVFQTKGCGANVYCRAVAVQKTGRDGSIVFTKALQGASDQLPFGFLFDSKDNIIVLGTTYSKDFPITPDALQPVYAGPTPPFTYGSPIVPGGDCFLTVLSPVGALLYSTYLGTTWDDTIIGVDAPSGGKVDLLIAAGSNNFPLVAGAPIPRLVIGPVLVTFDFDARAVVRSQYLPIQGSKSVTYYAVIEPDGRITVATEETLFRFARDGSLTDEISLAAYPSLEAPQPEYDSAGNLWLTFASDSIHGSTRVVELDPALNQLFNRTVPFYIDVGGVPIFDEAGRAYFSGTTSTLVGSVFYSPFQPTPNAFLETPCTTEDSAPAVAVLSPQGEFLLLSYLDPTAESLIRNPDGSVSVVLTDGSVYPIDLNQRPKIACTGDIFTVEQRNNYVYAWQTWGLGQVILLRGGGFGPPSSVVASTGADLGYSYSLAGLSVTVGGIPAPVVAAGSGEVEFEIPFGVTTGEKIPVVLTDSGTASNALSIEVETAAPFVVGPVFNQDGTANSNANPARWGDAITVYLTGGGPYSPALADGQVGPMNATHILQLPVGFFWAGAGQPQFPEAVLWAGAAPGAIGLAQLNLLLPQTKPQVPYPLLVGPHLTIGSSSAPLPAIFVQ